MEEEEKEGVEGGRGDCREAEEDAYCIKKDGGREGVEF